jgi:hypothetical protein
MALTFFPFSLFVYFLSLFLLRYEMHSIRTALSNFEDMRINAKELAILKDAKRTTLNAEKDQVRLDLIPSVSEWLVGFGWWLVAGWCDHDFCFGWF